MRNTLILVVLISLGLAVPAFADSRRAEHHDHSDYRRIEWNESGYARHDRGKKYGHFQKRMKKLRKELRHERRENRRLERRVQRIADRRADRRAYRHRDRHAPVVIAARRPYRPVYFPSIVVRFPLYW